MMASYETFEFITIMQRLTNEQFSSKSICTDAFVKEKKIRVMFFILISKQRFSARKLSQIFLCQKPPTEEILWISGAYCTQLLPEKKLW